MEDEHPPTSDADTSLDEFEDTRSRFDPTEDLDVGTLSSEDEEVILTPPPVDDANPDPIDPVALPPLDPPPVPIVPAVLVHGPPDGPMALGGGAGGGPGGGPDVMAEFRRAIVQAFQEANQNSTYPMPTFAGKKGDKPDDHTLHFEDYTQHYDIEGAHLEGGARAIAFVKTLTGKARAWADTTRGPAPDRVFPAYDAADGAARAVIEQTLKHRFFTRFAVQGRTPEALYAEWQNLAYDPAKDDIEDFVRDVKKLADQLGYGDTATLMAVRGALPLDLQNLMVNIDDLEAMKRLLIKIFDNPKMKQNYGKKESTANTSATGAFSQTTVTGEPLDKGMSYFLSRMDDLGSKVDKLKIRDQKARKPPYKPQMTPKRGRGGGQCQNNNYPRGCGDRNDY